MACKSISISIGARLRQQRHKCSDSRSAFIYVTEIELQVRGLKPSFLHDHQNTSKTEEVEEDNKLKTHTVVRTSTAKALTQQQLWGVCARAPATRCRCHRCCRSWREALRGASRLLAQHGSRAFVAVAFLGTPDQCCVHLLLIVHASVTARVFSEPTKLATQFAPTSLFHCAFLN